MQKTKKNSKKPFASDGIKDLNKAQNNRARAKSGYRNVRGEYLF